MAISRKLIITDDDDQCWVKVDHASLFILNETDDCQTVFGPNSELSNSAQIIKIAAKFDDDSFDNLKITAYLYDQRNANIANAGSCEFKIYKVSNPDWTDVLIGTLPGVQLSNSYFYSNPILSSFPTVDFLGGDSLMIEATIIRSGVTYRDRVYLNHLGVYGSVIRLKQDVEFLELTKLDE